MFEDIDEKAIAALPERPRDASDRMIVYLIWSRNEVKKLAPTEAWELLAERYPAEARFTLLETFEELASPESHRAWTPTAFLEKAQRVLDAAGGRLNPEVRDLLAVAEDELHGLGEADAARLDRIRSRVGARLGDASAARKRLARVSIDFVRDLHERTLGGKTIGARDAEKTARPSYPDALAAATGDKHAYAPSAKVAVGDVVEHAKFGAGVVTAVERVGDGGRATILFESGARKLVVG